MLVMAGNATGVTAPAANATVGQWNRRSLMFQFHRKEQFDIINGGIKNPILVIGWKTPDSYSRLFCLWSGGVWVRWFGKHRLCWQW